MFVSKLVFEGEIRRGRKPGPRFRRGRCGRRPGLRFRGRSRLAHRGRRRGRSGAAEAGEVARKAVHPAGEHHHAHQHQQHAARLCGVADRPLVALKEAEQRPGEEADREKRQDKAEGVEPDQGESGGGGARGRRHQKHARKGGADAGGPGKAERKAEQKRHQRIHREFIQPERELVPARKDAAAPEKAELVEAEEDHQDAARTGEKRFIAGEKTSGRRKTQAEHEKRKAYAGDKEKGVEHDPALLVMNGAVLVYRFGSPGEIADVERDERQDTGREKAQDALKEDSERRDAGSDCKAHERLLFSSNRIDWGIEPLHNSFQV